MPTHTKNLQGWILALVIFIMGGCGLAYEYTFSKIASDLLGNSVQQWAIVIAVMLFCMGLGAEIQRFISSKKVVTYLLYSQLLLALLGGFGPLLMLWAFTSYPFNFGLIHYSLISIMGILIGFEIPLITRINEDYSDDIRSNLARVLKMDYIGALAGALVWIFLLPKFFTLHQIAYVLAFLSIGSTLLCWWFFKKSTNKPYLLLSVIVVTTAILGYGFNKSDKWSLEAEQHLYTDRIVFSTTTPYQHIVLTQSTHGNLRCYINGHIQFSESDEHIYHEHLVHPAMSLSRNPKRVLILGGGDGMAVREVLKYPSVEEIVLVDLDPEMTRLATNHPIMSKLNDYSLKNAKVLTIANKASTTGDEYTLDTPSQRRIAWGQTFSEKPKLHIINIDAATFVKQAKGLFDVIICDFPDPSGPELAKLYSMHFYGELKNKLSADGYIVQQATSPYRAKEAFLCIGRTMKATGLTAVPYHDHVPSFGEWGWWISTHKPNASATEIKSNMAKIRNLPNPIQYLTPQIIRSSLAFGKSDLTTTETDITTISNSAVLRHYTNGWLE